MELENQGEEKGKGVLSSLAQVRQELTRFCIEKGISTDAVNQLMSPPKVRDPVGKDAQF